MKRATINVAITVSLLLAGCGKKAGSPSSTPSAATPVAQLVMAAWQGSDKSAAISSFVQTDWTSRPLFASSSALGLTEDQFKALSDPERQARSAEVTSQLDSLKRLAAAVAQAGRDAAAKGDTVQARKYFDSLKQCGTALESPECLALVQLVGRALKKMADNELTKAGQ